MPKLTPRSFRQFMGCFATGIAVITAVDPVKGTIGLTVNSLTSLSLTPPLILFCLDRTAKLYSPFKKASHFAINILSEKQEDISRHFADAHHNPLPRGVWAQPQMNCPILRETLGWMVCKKTATHKGGDHDIFVGEVLALYKRSGAIDPLLYFHGRYREIGH